MSDHFFGFTPGGRSFLSGTAAVKQAGWKAPKLPATVFRFDSAMKEAAYKAAPVKAEAAPVKAEAAPVNVEDSVSVIPVTREFFANKLLSCVMSHFSEASDSFEATLGAGFPVIYAYEDGISYAILAVDTHSGIYSVSVKIKES